MSFFVTSVVTPPAHLPISSTDTDLAAAVVDEVERMILWRAVVSQVRRITIDGPLPSRIELEPLTAIVGLTMWTPTDPDAVIDAASYTVVSRDPLGTIIAPNSSWPAPERSLGFILVGPTHAGGKSRRNPPPALVTRSTQYPPRSNSCSKGP